MIPRGLAKVMGKDCFNDAGVSQHIMYCTLLCIGPCQQHAPTAGISQRVVSNNWRSQEQNQKHLSEVATGGGPSFSCDSGGKKKTSPAVDLRIAILRARAGANAGHPEVFLGCSWAVASFP